MSTELRKFLSDHDIAQTRTTPYNPAGNGQCERYNGTLWRSILLLLKSRKLPESQWEQALPEALHAIRSLLCTSTNCTPHERFFVFARRSPSGVDLPDWLANPGRVLLRRFVRANKSDPLVDEVELVSSNPSYAHIKYGDGRQSTVSTKDLTPCNRHEEEQPLLELTESIESKAAPPVLTSTPIHNSASDVGEDTLPMTNQPETVLPRRSTRPSVIPDRYRV